MGMARWRGYDVVELALLYANQDLVPDFIARKIVRLPVKQDVQLRDKEVHSALAAKASETILYIRTTMNTREQVEQLDVHLMW